VNHHSNATVEGNQGEEGVAFEGVIMEELKNSSKIGNNPEKIRIAARVIGGSPG